MIKTLLHWCKMWLGFNYFPLKKAFGKVATVTKDLEWCIVQAFKNIFNKPYAIMQTAVNLASVNN